MRLSASKAKSLFEDRVRPKITITESGCWIYPHGDNGNGYRYVKWRENGRYFTQSAHRIAYCAFVGELEHSRVVRHTCDNPSCCNPEHLLQGTQKDNIHDMWSRGRRTPHRMLGLANPAAKLTPEQVKEIRANNTMMNKDIAIQYGVSKSLVSAIKRGELWNEAA